ncbi:MAG TPA: hypothetical protein VJU78_05050 [Chitinophagaceae bacterium]|nr:hypothetical protein [Chitinophagaceae bacterium]
MHTGGPHLKSKQDSLNPSQLTTVYKESPVLTRLPFSSLPSQALT